MSRLLTLFDPAAGALGGGASPDIDDIVTPLVWYKPYVQPDFVAGSPLAALTDYGSRATNATQATTASRATAQADGSLLFDGDDYYQTAAFSAAIAQPFEVFCVAKHTADGYTFDGIDSTNRCILSVTFGDYAIYAGSWLYSTLAAGATVVVDAKFSTTSSSIALNGGTAQSGSIGTKALAGLTVGTRYDATSVYLTGNLYEFVLCTGLTADQRAAITSILNTRWSVY